MIPTGRKFRCTGKRQSKAYFWNIHIEMGDVLNEVQEAGLNVPEGTLLLQVNGRDALLVDESQFKEVKVNPQLWLTKE